MIPVRDRCRDCGERRTPGYQLCRPCAERRYEEAQDRDKT